ncbi:MAG: amidohydrolase family protein, partial [Desulfosalsimonas sp.]
DTSLASSAEILDYIENYGSGRIMFGSDFPFGAPKEELAKVMDLPVSETVRQALLGKNIRRLIEKK